MNTKLIGGLLAVTIAVASLLLPPLLAAAQPREQLAQLVTEARALNQEIQSARSRAEAAAARIGPAGSLPDPMLSAGVMNVPVTSPSLSGGMSGLAVRLEQRLPPRGARSLRSSAARLEHEAILYDAVETERRVIAELKLSYFEFLFLESAQAVLDRNRALLVDMADVANARYAVAGVPQQDVLRAGTEVTRVDKQLAGLRARHSAALARVNAIVHRPATEPLAAEYPAGIRRLAESSPAASAFTVAALDDGIGHGLPGLAELQARAARGRALLLAHERRVEAALERVRLAERVRWPDVSVMLEYGPRFGAGDTWSAVVAVPLPIFADRKQNELVREAKLELAAAEQAYRQRLADVQADVAAKYAAALRTREQVQLLGDGVIPQARATIQSAAAAYQSGRVEFVTLLDAQAALFRQEIELARQLAYFGQALADLELTTGVELQEVQP